MANTNAVSSGIWALEFNIEPLDCTWGDGGLFNKLYRGPGDSPPTTREVWSLLVVQVKTKGPGCYDNSRADVRGAPPEGA